MQLIAALLMILGVGGCATGFSPMSMSILFLIGAAVWMVASIGAWWNHG